CDPEQYGRMIEYQFPKEKLIFGPLQIESRIDQNSEISQLFTLWSQSGSEIIRGNLLVIPVRDSLIYVEPVYLVSANSQLPELKIMIAAYQDRLSFAPTLDEALAKLFGARPGATAPGTPTAREQAEALAAGAAAASAGGAVTPEELRGLIDQALREYNGATQALSGGDFAAYGERIMALQKVLEELEARSR
ncbi:MAG: UPF0182 family protein, partial [Spirochaetales bacterium]|nr:UPF0182 family protein [Spirochaetales bacterium]